MSLGRLVVLLAASLALALAAGCATAQVAVAPTEAAKLERALVGQPRFLRVSMYSIPFFGDATKALLSALPPDEVDLVDHPDGSPVNPGRVEGVIPVGTMVKIRRVEFPSAAVMAERVLLTPRTLPWVYVELPTARGAMAGAGVAPDGRQNILVLRPGLKGSNEVLAEIDRYLAPGDPASLLATFTDGVRDGVQAKQAALDMPGEALEMAWGYPEMKRIESVNGQRKETWKWPRKRSAVLIDGRVTVLSEGGAERR